MTNKYLPNYRRATYLAHLFIIDYLNVSSLPINVEDIILRFKNIKIISYKDFAYLHEMPFNEVVKQFNSPLGACVYERTRKRYIIVYNNKNKLGLTRFTLAHELGHICLNHFDFVKSDIILRDYFNKNSLNEFDRALENEADCFARNALCPLAFKNLYQTPKQLQKIAVITKVAALARFSMLDLDEHNYNSITSQTPEQPSYSLNTQCKRCGSIIDKQEFCPICGFKSPYQYLLTGKETMQYKQFETNDGYQLKKCLICGNEDIEQDEKYCKICGHALINYCSHYDEYNDFNTCGKRLSPNARFCPDCGSHSDFYNAGLLQYWEDEKNGLEFTPKIPNTRIKDTAESSVSDATFDKDELPF